MTVASGSILFGVVGYIMSFGGTSLFSYIFIYLLFSETSLTNIIIVGIGIISGIYSCIFMVKNVRSYFSYVIIEESGVISRMLFEKHGGYFIAWDEMVEIVVNPISFDGFGSNVMYFCKISIEDYSIQKSRMKRKPFIERYQYGIIHDKDIITAEYGEEMLNEVLKYVDKSRICYTAWARK